jgi:hypothetical protein
MRVSRLESAQFCEFRADGRLLVRYRKVTAEQAVRPSLRRCPSFLVMEMLDF